MVSAELSPRWKSCRLDNNKRLPIDTKAALILTLCKGGTVTLKVVAGGDTFIKAEILVGVLCLYTLYHERVKADSVRI